MNVRLWSEELKHLREIILKPDKIEESKKLALKLHAMVHSSEMSGINEKTFEDEIWDGIDDASFRLSTNEKGRTVAYGIWHSTRIEDITMNILVANDTQVLVAGSWQKKINSSISDTGNQLSKEEIRNFSKDINMDELRKYRIAVGRKTEDIIKNLTADSMKRKFTKDQLQRIIDEGAVNTDEKAVWLIDFWGRKNVAGIILMPCTRHLLVHINESLKAKNAKIKKNR